jgi:rare lipoprotein A
MRSKQQRKAAIMVAALSVLAGVPAIAADVSLNQTGIASVYSGKESSRTASGETFKPHSMSAAHRTLPFGTMVRVTHGGNKNSVVVRIVDRGPFIRGRVIDLTPAAARALGFSGLAKVKLSAVSKRPVAPKTRAGIAVLGGAASSGL